MRVSTKPVLMAVATVMAAVLTACSPGNSAPSASSTGPTGSAAVSLSNFKGKTMTYVYFTDGPDLAATRTAIAGFEKATGATVKLQILPFADLDTSLQARLSGGNAPEAARVADWHPYASDVVNFKDYFGSTYPQQFTAGLAAASQDNSGRMLAVPSDLTINGPFINVDAFKKAGVAIPTKWTWTQLVADAKKVQAANQMESAIAIDKSGNRVSTILSQYGTTLIGKGHTNALDPAKATQALNMLTGLIQSGSISKDFWLGAGSKYAGANDIFLAKQAAVYLSGPWQVGAFNKSAKFTWAAAPNPCETRCGGFPGGKYMVAFKNSKDPALGAAFVEWLNRTTNQSTVDKTAFWLPTRKDLTTSGVNYPSRNSDMKTFIKQITLTPQDTFASNSDPAFTASGKALISEIDKVVAGQQTVGAAVKNLQGEIDKALKATP